MLGRCQAAGRGETMDRPKKSRVRKSSLQRQREIIEATLELVAEYGLQGTTVGRIAHAAGISRGALYQHFENREAVLAAALELMAERASPWTWAPQSQDAYHQLIDMGARHAAFAASEFDSFVRPNVELMATAVGGGVGGQVRERVLRVLDRFTKLVERGKLDGSIRADVDSRDVAWALLVHAWAEDQALVVGVDELVTSGASVRNFRRILDSVATVPDDGSGAPAGQSS
jgi:AcrR family transcriptional regulator